MEETSSTTMPKKPKAVPKTRLHLNLLYPQSAQQQLAIRFVRWLLSYGRVILIIVELLVLGAFGMRFKLDEDLANLKDEINKQVPFIEVLANDSMTIKQTQSELSTIKDSFTFNNLYTSALTKIAKMTPIGVRFDSLNLDKATATSVDFRIAGKSPTNTDLAIILANLKADPNFSNVTLANISIEEGLTSFTITGTVN